MGFVLKRSGDEEDGFIRDLTGQRKRAKDEVGGQEQSLRLDLELRACAVCRRELLPWQETCPDDGGPAVPRTELPPQRDALLERLTGGDPAEDAGLRPPPD